MAVELEKMQLSEGDIQSTLKASVAAVEEFIPKARPSSNVRGLGVGTKWTNGEPTGEPAIVVLVTQKVAEEHLTKADLVPPSLQGVQTDVLAIGEPFAGDGGVGGNVGIGVQTLAKRLRPAEGGYSVGHFQITAGTIATCVYDILPGGSGGANPVHGAGVPPRFYILSNNHVLANTNAAALGDPILQPGPFDGGVNPADVIARLSRFVPIQLTPAVPIGSHNNLVDAAVAEGQFHDLDREIYWNGYVRGWRRRTNVLNMVGHVVKKTGRTTNFTTGRITVVNATVDVNYGGGRVGRFKDQILTTAMSAGGDSGSLVTTLDNVAIGLLYAGSAQVTILNQIENVRGLLRVEVAEQIL
jgi:hypothetical protein